MSEVNTEYNPDWISPPGDTILDSIAERNWKQLELSRRLGISKKHLNQLTKGKVPLTPEMARRLATVIGSTEEFWLRREARYQDRLMKIKSQKLYEEWITWIDKFPINELKRANILTRQRATKSNKTKFVNELLKFFAVSSPNEWEQLYSKMQVAFRHTNNGNVNIGAISAWLRQGELCAEQMAREFHGENEISKFNKTKFEQSLRQIRRLTVYSPEEFRQEMNQLCLDAGVILVFVPSIPKARVSGVARWLHKSRPLIQLSLYGKTNDKFWFTFFHEAAHLLLHSNEKNLIFLDDKPNGSAGKSMEIEANTWAENMLIPEEYKYDLSDLRSKGSVIKFASSINLHPGIVVGRIQKERIISFSSMNDLKDRCSFEEEQNS